MVQKLHFNEKAYLTLKDQFEDNNGVMADAFEQLYEQDREQTKMS
jgi:hypothetical protein